MSIRHLQKILAILMVPAALLLLANCGTSRKAKVKQTSYERDIQPIMIRSCSPCHFPEKGKKKLLHTFEATRDNIRVIIERVQLPSDHEEFMPFKSKRQVLSQEEIALFKLWYEEEMPR